MYDPTKPYKKQILDLAERTYDSKYVKTKKGAVYSTFKRKFPYSMIWPLLGVRELDHTDGGGTKGIYHWQQRTFKNAVLDALAMNLNDMLLERARPYKLQNHIMVPEDDHDAIVEIVQAMSDECSKRSIVITGGETSVQNNIQGLDISMTVSGFIPKKFPYLLQKAKPNRFKAGDALVGIASNGLHSNGFTKVREVFGEEFRPEFVEPTRIYLEEIVNVEKKHNIHGMMHITGGAYTKLKDLLPNLDAVITRDHSLQPQDIFDEIYSRGVSDEQMYKTFNCGIGFVLGMKKKDAHKLIEGRQGYDVIGEVVEGTGRVRIHSMFSGKHIEL